MADVARYAGVSPQTVSRVANEHPGVVDGTRQRVLDAMEDLRYRPNSAARALKRGSFQSLGVVLSGLTSTGNYLTLEGIVRSANQHGYSMTVMTLDEASDENLGNIFHRMSEAAVDGAILLLEIEAADELHLTRLPYDRLVIVDSNAAYRFPVVDSDQASGTRAVMDHLLGLGHSTVHHVGGPENSFSAAARADSWREYLVAHGRPVPEPIIGDWSAESGYRAGVHIADDGVATAVFVANDEMALGLMRALGERGIRVPQDVSVVGFDDIALAANFPVPLTTVHQNFDEVGRRCVEMLIRRIEGDSVPPGVDLVPTSLVVRQSTAPPWR
ncbi:LacI family DNA-binding transcriptional regulator [Tessaracoccus antarcticus]|uniref:LacI family DNA-binding transcriptional regulator n=2 Tax=Tessaracoccus antarcticus TaxID=2479848 RepID=A0A3M0GBR1_9ACTN|nr:LacI family DNA-binding transcriptional regulator [Tessaracoccus antarcticus]